jgi:hypothetical protein
MGEFRSQATKNQKMDGGSIRGFLASELIPAGRSSSAPHGVFQQPWLACAEQRWGIFRSEF